MSATLTVLDVGHGNAAVLAGPDGVVVIDAGPGGADLLRYPREEDLTEVKCVVISHVDADHLRGLIAVLEEPTIRVAQVRLNPDAAKESELWDDLAWTLAHLDQEGECDFRTSCVHGDILPGSPPRCPSRFSLPARSRPPQVRLNRPIGLHGHHEHLQHRCTDRYG